MDRAAPADADPDEPIIRPMEPADALGMAALLGRFGTAEGTLQVADASLATRLEFLQRADEGSHWLPRLTIE